VVFSPISPSFYHHLFSPIQKDWYPPKNLPILVAQHGDPPINLTMESYLPQFLTVACIHLLGAASPGPDFLMITRNSLLGSRRAGIFSAMGLGLGVIVHVSYCLLGIAVIISKSILLFSALKCLGSLYLLYIGWKSLRSRGSPSTATEPSGTIQLTDAKAIRMGFLTNVFNPKVTLFFLMLFTQVIKPGTPLAVELIYGAEMVIMTFLWFALVAMFFSHEKLQTRFLKIGKTLDRIFGAVLIALGIKVIWSTIQSFPKS
jgi:RhtB (resistance to homoserine/threonine) family protein